MKQEFIAIVRGGGDAKFLRDYSFRKSFRMIDRSIDRSIGPQMNGIIQS